MAVKCRPSATGFTLKNDRPIEAQIKALPRSLQTRMALYALEGWRFEYDFATSGWFAHPPHEFRGCLWDVSLKHLLGRREFTMSEERRNKLWVEG